MTKLKINVKNNKKFEKITELNGAYLATFEDADDRILVYQHGKIQEVIDADRDNELRFQGKSVAHYSNLKKIKKMTIKVELE